MVSIDKNKVHIFDNIIPVSTQDALVDKIGQIEWRLAVNNRPHKYKIKIKDSDIWNQNRPGLIQSFHFDEGRWTKNSLRWFVEPPLTALAIKLGKAFELQRIKVNLNPKDVPENRGSCFHPHSDLKTDEWTAIYYVNESDGDTIFYDDNKKEIKRFKPKKGTGLVFKSYTLHAGSNPVKYDKRIVINFIFYE